MFPRVLALTIATGSLALAAPAPSSSPTPPAHGEFNIDLVGYIGAGQVSYIAHAVPATSSSSSSSDSVYIIATPEINNTLPGTKAFFSGEGSEGLTLSLDLTDSQDPGCQGVYDVVVPDVGMAAGYAADVLGIEGGDDEGWNFENDEITHQLQAATAQNQFYLCDQEVNGASEKVLSFGSPFADGTSPAGCIPAGIFQGTIRN